jgi:N-acetylmuramoyl-L-alanine amidase
VAIYPGAVFKPTDFGGRTPRAEQGRGILHVAVSERRSLPPFNGNTWHFYVAKDGYCEQYVDTAFRAFADVEANDDAIAIETQGGTGSSAQVESELWTPAQEERLADIMRWARAVHGVPLELLPDSRPGRRGWGPHRLGIQHSRGVGAVSGWLQPGGERWSTVVGKLCPGAAKVGQIPGILGKAAGGGVSPPPSAPPVPPPVVIPGAPPRLGWDLPRGHYYGNIRGPARSHGGYHVRERPFVQNIQQWLIWRGCVAEVPSRDHNRSGWDDGLWEAATDRAMIEFHRRFYPGQPYPAQCWADDYDRLARVAPVSSTTQRGLRALLSRLSGMRPGRPAREQRTARV